MAATTTQSEFSRAVSRRHLPRCSLHYQVQATLHRLAASTVDMKYFERGNEGLEGLYFNYYYVTNYKLQGLTGTPPPGRQLDGVRATYR